MPASITALSTDRGSDMRFFGGRSLSEGEDGRSVRQIVAILILLLALIGGGLWLTHALRGAATIQDCVSAGRTNCAPIQN
jgi:hypothetical protein